MKIKNKLLKRLLRPILGKKQLQGLFENLHLFSLAGMNIGAAEVDDSGEDAALRHIRSKFSSPEKIIIFDVGANIGKYSLLCCGVLKDKEMEIFSFEPHPQIFSCLSDNIEHSLCNDKIKLFNFGFSDANKNLKLHFNKENFGLSSLYKRNLSHINLHLDEAVDVQLKTIDEFLKEEKISHIHLLKIDTEGHEINVLNGAKSIIDSNNVSYIQFEFGGCNIDSKTYFRDFWHLLNDKYKIYRIVKNGLQPINNYEERHEIFITTNYLAENRNLGKN